MQLSKEIVEFNDALVESIDETISTLLSRQVVEALYCHLDTTYSISKAEIPYRIETVFAALEKTFGPMSSKTIGKVIAKRLYGKLGLAFADNHDKTLQEYVEEAKIKLQSGESQP